MRTSVTSTLLTSLIVLPLAPLTGCKARRDNSSNVRSAPQAESGDSLESKTSMLLDSIETGLAQVEPVIELAGDPGLPDGLDVQGLALNDDSIDERKHMLDLAKQLSEYAADKVVTNREEVEALAEELEGLASLLSGLSAADRKRAKDAVSRVRGILASPPQVNKPANQQAQATTPAQQNQGGGSLGQLESANNNDSLYCRDLGNNSWLPTVRNGNRTIGYPVQNGNQGFTKLSNCELAISSSRNGLVCSISMDDHVSPFRISSGKMVGPKIGFAQTVNCVAVVKASTDTICIVDNRDEVKKYAKYNVATGAVVDYWFDDMTRCQNNDKSPDPRRACLDRCEEVYAQCRRRAEYKTGMAQTSAKLDCMLENMDCRKACE